MPPLSFASAARWGLRVGAGPTVSGAEWNGVKSRRVRRPGGRPSDVSWRGGLPRPSERGLATGERNSRLLAGGVGFLLFQAFERGALAERELAFLSSLGELTFFGCVGWAWLRREGLPQPARETQPPPNQRLPPRERRTKRRRTAARTPELHRQSNAMEIERCNPTLEPLPTNTDQNLPTPSGPTDLKMLSHTFY